MTNKEKARAYFGAVNACDQAAVTAMVDENYIQHNPFVPTGRAAFISFLPKLKEHGSRIENIRMLQDGSHIIMHHLWKNAIPFGKEEMAAFHIIRFDQAGLIAEHWSVMTEMRPPNPAGRTLVDGQTQVQDLHLGEKNKAIVTELLALWTERSRKNWREILPRYFKRDFHQHSAMIADGIDGLTEAIDKEILSIEGRHSHQIFCEGNFVLSISEALLRGRNIACYDLFRLDEGLIEEHWNITQDIPRENLANQNTMFNFGMT